MAVIRADWIALMGAEYLDSFIPAGGAAVRFVVADAAGRDAVARDLDRRATAAGVRVIRVSLGETRLHMLQHFFFALARAIPWETLLQARAEALVREAGHRWPQPGARVKFACPGCKAAAWGKPSLDLTCNPCNERMVSAGAANA